MSITYPEAPSSTTSKRAGGTAIMNSGSALFPTGATGVYERAAKARAGKKTPLVWVAAPLAVVLIGGAAYLAVTHQKAAAPAPTAHMTTTTVTTPIAVRATSLNVQPAAPAAPAPVVAQTNRVTHVQTSVRTTGPAPRAKADAHVTRTTTISHSVLSTPVAAPVQAAPAVIAPNPAAAPTPGTFAFTPAAPAASAVITTPDTVTPAAAPVPAPSPAAQPAPQV
jgi:hypothetical protein